MPLYRQARSLKDIVVKNGDIRVEGKVNGNVTVINGEILNNDRYLASTGWLPVKSKRLIKFLNGYGII